LLSFLAKFGASIPDREILGGHTGRMKSVLTYSRDSLASPLRVLNNMLERIRQGLWFLMPPATSVPSPCFFSSSVADVALMARSLHESKQQKHCTRTKSP